jgi:hypothetical protein
MCDCMAHKVDNGEFTLAAPTCHVSRQPQVQALARLRRLLRHSQVLQLGQLGPLLWDGALELVAAQVPARGVQCSAVVPVRAVLEKQLSTMLTWAHGASGETAEPASGSVG